MSEEQTVNSTRKKLHNYSALDGLNGFFKKIVDNAEHFDVISATERRCYNIVVRFLPFLGVVSNNALLLMYKEMADHYEETGELPKILIIDDIMIHGRGLSKFLYRFETVIIEELERRGYLCAPEDYLYFRMQFTKSVTIYIYAKNSGALLLAPRFLSRIEPWEEMHVGKLRNLSMQLSDCLSRWDIANTSFAYSVRSIELAYNIENLFAELLKDNKEKNESLYEGLVRIYGDSKISNVNFANKWIPLIWKYNNERMYLFIRLFGVKEIERISTIRYFPERRHKREPLITSYTILGDISTDTLESVCMECADKLPKCQALRDVLLNRNERLNDIKGQLLSTLLAIVDFGEFCETTFGQLFSTEGYLMDDLRKIARNYNRSNFLFEELKSIANSRRDQTTLSNVFALHLYENISTILDVDIAKCNRLRLSANDIERINKQVDWYTRRSVYQLGAGAEKGALVAERNPEEFLRDAYKKLDFSSYDLFLNKNTKTNSPTAYMNLEFVFDEEDEYSAWNGLDLTQGVLPLRICAKDMARMFEKKFTADSVYCFIASLIAVMDNGLISIRKALEDDKLVSMAKAGEMAVFYVPSRFSLFIPAFAEIEEKYYGNSEKLIGQIVDFVQDYLKSKEVLKKIIILVAQKTDEPQARVEKIITASILSAFADKKRYETDLQRFYKIGHSFRSWNFLNLTNQDNSVLSTFQAILAELAKRI